MKLLTKISSFEKLPKTYAKLVSLLPPRPIHDAVACENAIEMTDALAGQRLNRDQDDYLEALSIFIEAYESETLNEPRMSGTEALEHILKQSGTAGDGLAKILEVDRSLAFKLIKGSRKLTAEHIRKLSKKFHVSADLFLP